MTPDSKLGSTPEQLCIGIAFAFAVTSAAAQSGENVTVVGCAQPGVESQCVVMQSGGAGYEISGANPAPAWDHWIQVTGTRAGASTCQQGTALTNIKWAYVVKAQACPARPSNPLRDPGPPYNPHTPSVAIDFNGHKDGSGSYVRIPDAPDLHLTTNLTLEATVYWNGANGYVGLVSKPRKDAGSAGTGYTMALTDGKPILGIISQPEANRSGATAASPLPANTWTAVAMTYDGQRSTTYVNGVQVGRQDFGNIAPVFQGSTGILIGREFMTDLIQRAFGGRLADVRIWNATLSPQTIAAWDVVDTPLDQHPNHGALVARWLLNEGQGTVANDTSGHGHNGTLADGASWRQSQ